MEATVIDLASYLRTDQEFRIRVLFKLTHGSSDTRNLIRHCDEKGIRPYFSKSASRDLLKHLLWTDIVHANNAPPDVVFTSKMLNKPVALTIHHQGKTSNPIRRQLWYWSNRLADIRCYNSKFVRNTWEPHADLPNSYTVPTMTGLPAFKKSAEDKSGFFFISRWIKNKGVKTLINAYQTANIDHEKWPLTMAGEGPLQDEVKTLIREQNLKTVHILGYITEKEKYHQIRKAKWLVAPPDTKEDLGLTPIEARSQGIPSIVTLDGGLPEAAGRAAITCTPGSTESLSRALEHVTQMSESEYQKR